ncbi:zinc finger protein ZPR1-like [Trifolium pratense]|uniref:Zinc finger protein ZPR1-like n=1 Tax=Trifolium pratense TaxID=57577 RepID=A0A2K3M6T1_TRIPR|nr:zinc finger protein ZPR1-like [Trifolium pratense]
MATWCYQVPAMAGLEKVHGYSFGDSLEDHRKSKWLDFQTRLNKLLSLDEAWTLILDDALANSFVAPVTDDLKDDHQLTCPFAPNGILPYQFIEKFCILIIVD